MRIVIRSDIWSEKIGYEFPKQLKLDVAKWQQEKVVTSFKAVKSKIYNMDGGVGSLEPAVEQLDERTERVEAHKAEKIDLAAQSLGAFLHNVQQADRRAAQTIGELNEKFYEANPWAVPPPPPKKKSLWQRIKDAFKKAGKAIANAFKKAVDWVVGVAKKIWKSIKDFVVKHWKAIVKIVVGIVVIAGLAALSVFTGGAAAPLFALAAKGAAIAAGVGAATTVVTGIAQGKSAGEIFDACGDAILVGAITGGVTGVAGAAAGAVTSATGSQVLGELTKIGIQMGGKILAQGSSYLIDHDGSLSGFWDAKGESILISGGTAAAAVVGGALLDQGKELLGGVYDGLKDSQLGHAIQKGYEWCQEKMPTLTGLVTDGFKDTFGNLSWNDLSKLSNPADFAKSLGMSMVNNIAGNAMGAAGDFLTNDLNNLTGGAVNSVIDSVKGSGIGQAIGDIGSAVNSAIGDVTSAIGGVADSVNGVINDISGQIGSAVGDISHQISGVVGSIGDQFKGVTGSLGGMVSDIANQIGGAMPSIQMPSFDGIGQAVVGAVVGAVGDAVGDAVSGAVGDVTGQIGSAINTTLPALDKVQGVIGGIQGNLGVALDSVTSQAQGVVTVILPDFSKLNAVAGGVGALGMAASAAPAALTQATGVTVGGWLSHIRL